MLNVDGFTWAENLIFDGLGSLFVSEAVGGELWRIVYDPVNNNYTSSIYLNKGFKQFGGLSVSDNGKILYAGVVFDDKDEYHS